MSVRPFRRISVRGFAVLAAFAAALVFAVTPANAATGGNGHTVTITENTHGTVYDNEVNPCSGDNLAIVDKTNMVNHVTYFPASDETWGTFTEEDDLTATDEGTGVVYTGHDTVWGNFNVNKQNSNNTFTFSIHVKGSDGSTISGHEVAHVVYNATDPVNPVVSFDRSFTTCG